MAEFRLLGLVEMWSGGRPVDMGQPRQRSVLAALLVDAGRPVPAETLVDRVWGEVAPDRARHAMHEYLARIRRALAQVGDESVRLVRHAGVYVLEVDPDQVDLHLFRRLVEQARDPQVPDSDRAGMLREALDLWRGEPLAGLTGAWVDRIREGCRRQRLDAAVLWAQAALRLGEAATVVDVLRGLSVEYPIAEPLAGLLMRGLHATGRTAEALDCYTSVRKRLIEELGIEPGAELQAVHQAVLRAEPEAVPAPVLPPAEPSPIVPAQLPVAVRGFVGRGTEIARLDRLLTEVGDPRSAVVIAVVAGTAGVGKTALAVYWAHRVADRFPDGQLYVNLRGFDPNESEMTPAEAIRGFLDALDVPPNRIPAGLEAQAALYRSRLADKRMLLLLDNAHDAEQIRPLLPGTPGCLALVTSRNQLTSLVATEGAFPVTLDLLTDDEAKEMICRRVGRNRLTEAAGAVDEIVARCARLPLALSIVAARAATYPDFPLTSLADELRHTQGGLDALAGGDAATDLRAVLSWSYRTLSPAAARLFRLLGLHPGPDIGVPAVASLAGVPLRQARQLLGELARANLANEPSPGRFGRHDLLRAYAGELTQTVDGTDDRRAALGRLMDHYLHTAFAAARLLDEHRDPIQLAEPVPGVVPEELTDHDRALDWFTLEHSALLTLISQADQLGFPAHAWQLAWACTTFFDRRGHWHDWAATHRMALAAAERAGDEPGQAYAHRGSGIAAARLGRYAEAHTHFQRALELFEGLGDPIGRAHTHLNLGWALARQDRYREALIHGEAGLELYRAEGHRFGLTRALNNVGLYHAQLGDHEQTLAYCARALGLYREVGNRAGEAAAWDSLGFAHHQLGNFLEAAEAFGQALDLCREVGDRRNEATVLMHLGDTRLAADEPEPARQAWRQALTILEQLDHPDAAQLRNRLTD